MSSKIKAVIVTNVPAPYRVPVWRRVAESDDIDLDLIFCAPAHIDTAAKPDDYGFNLHFLTGRYVIKDKSFLHSDIKVWSVLNHLQPDVVITTGYIPTFLFAFAWAFFHRVPHIAMTDGTLNSEKSLSIIHRLVRGMVISRSKAFIGACEGSRALFKQYGVNPQKVQMSYLCTDNISYRIPASATPDDFIFCGRFITLKRPLFALEIAHEVALRLQRKTSILLVGSGELEAQMRTKAEEIVEFVDCHFVGYATQAELPKHYANARILLFPSESDVWGVVANEACAAGLPVIVSPYAGVAGELIIEGENGFICELDLKLWVEAAVTLLSNIDLYQDFSQNCHKLVAKYSYDNSALGICNAIKQAYA